MNDTHPEQSANMSKLLADEANPEIAHLREKVEMLMNERVTPALSAVANRAEEAAHAASETLHDGAERVVETVRARPLTSLGIAAAAGFILASMVRR